MKLFRNLVVVVAFVASVFGVSVAPTAEAADFTYGDESIHTYDSSIYYPDSGKAHLYVQYKSKFGGNYKYLVEANWEETPYTLYILDDNGNRIIDSYNRYAYIVCNYHLATEVCAYLRDRY